VYIGKGAGRGGGRWENIGMLRVLADRRHWRVREDVLKPGKR